MRIFVVDDDPAMRWLAREVIKPHFDGEIDEFADGAELVGAMELAPDVVLLDVQMPRMDGIAACRMLRANGHEDAHVIFASGADDPATRIAAYEAGGNDFLTKPYCSDELVCKLRAAGRVARRRAVMSAEAHVARTAALDAMVAMADIGVVLDFLRIAAHCGDCRQLAEAAATSLTALGLGGRMALWTGNGEYVFDIDGEGAARQPELLLARCDTADAEAHVAIFRSRVTLMVTGFPDDEERAMRLRHHGATLAEGMNARLAVLDARAPDANRDAGYEYGREP